MADDYDPNDSEIIAGANDRRLRVEIRDAEKQTDNYILGWRNADDPKIPNKAPEQNQLEVAAQTK